MGWIILGLIFLKDLYAIDCPNAKTINQREVYLLTDIEPEGGLILYLGAGILDYINFGISYGAVGVIGEGMPEFYQRPEVQFKYLFIYESEIFPAMLIGFDSQGRGKYLKEKKVYQMKSKGIYLAMEKNWEIINGNFILCGGVNYSILEKEKPKDNPSLFASASLNLTPELQLNLEWDGQFDYIQKSSDIGLLSASIKFAFGEQLTFNLIFRNLKGTISRAVKIVYLTSL